MNALDILEELNKKLKEALAEKSKYLEYYPPQEWADDVRFCQGKVEALEYAISLFK